MTRHRVNFISVLCAAIVLIDGPLTAAAGQTLQAPPRLGVSGSHQLLSIDLSREELQLQQRSSRTGGAARKKKVLVATAAGLGLGLYVGYQASRSVDSSRVGAMVGLTALFTGIGAAVGLAMPEVHPGGDADERKRRHDDLN